jgi:hypothetical protein
MLTRMAETPKRDLSQSDSARPPGRASNGRASILTELPRTRPQRVSGRRGGAARKSESKAGENVLAGLPRARPQRASPRRAAARKARANGGQPRAQRQAAQREAIPRQGFEAESEELTGSVQPPGGADLIASAGELAGELAKTGLATGGRLLRDFLSRLPG